MGSGKVITCAIAVLLMATISGCLGSNDQTVDPRDERAALAALERYFKHLDTPCEYLTEAARTTWEEAAPKGCQAQPVPRRGATDRLPRFGPAGAESGLALVAVTFGDREQGVWVLRDVDGEWLVDDFFGIPNPERLEDEDLSDDGALDLAEEYAVASTPKPGEPDDTDRSAPQLIVATDDVALAYFDEVGANATEIDYEGEILFLERRGGTWRDTKLRFAYPS